MWVITNRFKIEEREGGPLYSWDSGYWLDSKRTPFCVGKSAFETREEAVEALKFRREEVAKRLQKFDAAIAEAEKCQPG